MAEVMKNYYIFEYVYDPNEEEYTSIEGEVQAYVKAGDPFDACEKTGYTDHNRYFAKPLENLDSHVESIKKERKHLSKISKQLKEMVAEHEEQMKKCPNCGADLDEEHNCPECSFGHEFDGVMSDPEI